MGQGPPGAQVGQTLPLQPARSRSLRATSRPWAPLPGIWMPTCTRTTSSVTPLAGGSATARTRIRLFLQIGFPGPHPPYDPTPDALAAYAKRRHSGAAPSARRSCARSRLRSSKLRENMIEFNFDSVAWRRDISAADLLRLRRHYAANVSMIDAAGGPHTGRAGCPWLPRQRAGCLHLRPCRCAWASTATSRSGRCTTRWCVCR